MYHIPHCRHLPDSLPDINGLAWFLIDMANWPWVSLMNISLNDFVKKFRAERSPAAIDQTGVRAIVFVLAVMLISSAQGWETGIHEDAAINFDEQLSLHSLLLLTINLQVHRCFLRMCLQLVQLLCFLTHLCDLQ